MFINPQPLDKKNDVDLCILPREDFAFCKDQLSALVGLSEILPCSRELPVLFSKFEDTFSPIVLLGTPVFGNMVLEDGRWNAGYIPAVFRAYPFLLLQIDNEQKQLTIGVDRDCSLLSTEDGEALFNAEGEASDILLSAGQMLSSIRADQQRAALLGSYLASKNLLVPFSITANAGGEQAQPQVFSFDGLYFVEEKSLAQLADEDFLFLKNEGALPFLYAHIFSLSRIGRVFRTLPPSKSVPQ